MPRPPGVADGAGTPRPEWGGGFTSPFSTSSVAQMRSAAKRAALRSDRGPGSDSWPNVLASCGVS
jgi:hypothetical protein